MKSHANLHHEVCSVSNLLSASRAAMRGKLTSQFFAKIYLDGFDHFVKQQLRVKGYVRYVDDFLLFAESREQARAWGNACRKYLRGLHLEIHQDKYRLCRTDREGADFCGFVCYRSGRIKVCWASVRRYVKRLRLLQNAGLHKDVHDRKETPP